MVAALPGFLAAAQSPAPRASRSWNPKLGVYCRYSEANVQFVRDEGFTSIQLAAQKPSLDPAMADEALEKVKRVLGRSGLYVSALGSTVNHIDPDPDRRARTNADFLKVIELAGKLGAPSVGTASGTMPGQPLGRQVEEIVRIYTEKYFPACEKNRVRLLWEPYAGGPNVATGPVGYEALFRAFGDSPYVGLQYDPSHLVWQMMDPIQCARDFIGKIHDVHLKDTEIMWPVLRRVGIRPLDDTRWWRFRLPGSGCIDWKAFFTVLMEAGYSGAMNIEHEDAFYYPNYQDGEFTEQFKAGFRVAHAYLRQFVPARAATGPVR
ncbi:MAG: sugar phosphate isomerase/epimerase [Acidobacteriota bacterium]